ncbi:hypothetical protein [Pontibacillus salipaludis]|uniref:hypothetical protein n=1 Tax=Pontibacillus salipaludis TaxID=1697394 RepID=UPI0031EC6F49
MFIEILQRCTKHLFFISIVFILIGCSNESPKEAIDNRWSGELDVHEIISKKEITYGTVVLFSAYNVDENDALERVGVALLAKHSDSNWEVIDTTVESVENDSFAAHHKIVHIENGKGKETEIPIAFGKVEDKRVSSITARVNNKVEKIEILPINSGRYFYKLNAWGPIKALDENGEVMEQYGS